MTQNSGNPFGIPGFTSPPDGAGANPVWQSLDMMRQVWGNLGSLPASVPVSPGMSTEELDRRITDLRAVENWLNLNLTMLKGTIQGLEVQRATITTLRSFAQSVQSAYSGHEADAGSATHPPSPLEVVLGLRPAPAGAAKPAESAPAAKPAEPPPAAAQGASQDAPRDTPDGAAPLHGMPGANAWWSMLQEQFNRIASASAAKAAAQPAAPQASHGAAPAAAPAAARTAAKPATKSAPRKRPAAAKTGAARGPRGKA